MCPAVKSVSQPGRRKKSRPEAAVQPTCRFCRAPLATVFADLGMSPLCESFLSQEEIGRAEVFYPLRVFVCDRCFLVQLETFVPPESIFDDYAYFSSYSSAWVEHARAYVEAMRTRLHLGSEDLVVEIASNDGYLLQHLVGSEIPILGIEPARNVARVAVARGVPTLVEFFGRELARRLVTEGKRASLIVANNVFAQVSDINDFVAGIAMLLAPGGTATLEFPHLLRLVEGLQYDTIYHEHFSYFSLRTAIEILAAHRLQVVDVEELWTHGGSLRVYAQHASGRTPSASVASVLRAERAADLGSRDCAARFAEAVKESKRCLLEMLIMLRRRRKQVVGYGAPGKGNTLLNYCGIRTDLLDYTVDRNPYKHGLFTPGTHIPIHPVERIAETKPDYILVLPWNLIDEIAEQISYVAEWGAKLIVPIPYAAIRETG